MTTRSEPHFLLFLAVYAILAALMICTFFESWRFAFHAAIIMLLIHQYEERCGRLHPDVIALNIIFATVMAAVAHSHDQLKIMNYSTLFVAFGFAIFTRSNKA